MQNNSSSDLSRLWLPATCIFCVFVALYIVVQAMQRGVSSAVTYVAVILGLIWVVAGRKVWWLPIPISAAMGGLIWVGFRIYTHELSLLMAAATLLPAMALNYRLFDQHRPPLKWPVVTLCCYLIIHLGTSLVVQYNDEGGLSKMGNILRTYMGALWAVIFVIAYHKFGSSKLVRLTTGLIYAALAVRVLVGVYSYFFPGLLFVPAFSVFFVLSETGSVDLRGPPLQLIILSLGYFSANRRFVPKSLHLLAVVVCAWLLLLGGSRVSVAIMVVVPVLWMIVQRRFFLLGILLTLFFSGMIALNTNPRILDELPLPTQRALSILIIGDRLDIQAKQQGSNDWHANLFRMGRERWLASPVHFLVGYTVKPFDETFYSARVDFYHRLEVAADTARYERSLWTVLATLGLVGGLLYVMTFYILLRGPVQDLWRDGIAEFRHVVYFIGFATTTIWFCFSPIHGSFPGQELMWSVLAFAVHYDYRRQLTSLAQPPPPVVPPGAKRPSLPHRFS